jgi:hypothetical protein
MCQHSTGEDWLPPWLPPSALLFVSGSFAGASVRAEAAQAGEYPFAGLSETSKPNEAPKKPPRSWREEFFTENCRVQEGDHVAVQHPRRTQYVLEPVGLSDRTSNLPRELSRGQMQRSAMRLCSDRRSEILVADEPTGNLDTATGEPSSPCSNGSRLRTGSQIRPTTHRWTDREGGGRRVPVTRASSFSGTIRTGLRGLRGIPGRV